VIVTISTASGERNKGIPKNKTEDNYDKLVVFTENAGTARLNAKKMSKEKSSRIRRIQIGTRTIRSDTRGRLYGESCGVNSAL
jgi:hypothetical protein